MVRETRHLWVGNLPHTIREERILDHFKRYGKVQSVKILPKKEDDSGGACATVAFIDIKSAAKAHNADNKIEDRTLKTDYYEPPASSTASSAIYIHERDDALVRNSTASYSTPRTPRYGLSEERNYERPGHYYSDREPYLRRPLGMGYHDEDNYQGRAKSRDRYSRSNSGNTYTEGTDRNQNHFRSHNTRQHFEQQRYPVGEQYSDERDAAATTPRLNRRTNNNIAAPVVASVASPTTTRSESRPRRTKRRSRTPSRTPSGSRSSSGSRSRSRSSSGSRSSSSSSKVRATSSDSSGRSRSPSKSRSPAASYSSQNNTKGSRLDRPSSAIANPSSTVNYLPSAVNTSAINCTSNTQSSTPMQGCPLDSLQNNCDKEEKRPLGICVRNLPVRSTDTSLKDGLFHEYKKHGKVTMVKVIGQGTERYAVVCFKKPEDVEKALEVSKDKHFFGCKIEVTAHEGLDAEDNEFRPLEAELDEYHPKATRTLFIGNLEKDITTAELRKHFDQFGEIIEIDIKKQGSATSYAFIQYSDIASVVKAMRKLDGENLGANRIKLGFGKSMPTNCVWLDGVSEKVTENFLRRHINTRLVSPNYVAIDREKGHALVFFESVECAQMAVSELRGRILQGKKLQVDFASRECQTTFFEKLEMTGQLPPGEVSNRPLDRDRRDRRSNDFDVVRNDDREARVGFENRSYARYEGQARVNRGNFRGNQRTGFPGRGRGQNFPRYEIYHDEFGERRHRYRDENETTFIDGKLDLLKYTDNPDCPSRKRNKLRNSISDQESHHSQSPPRSRHQSRSTSPVSKERKSLKDRLHHRIKSPGSHNSSLVNSPCRDAMLDDLETNCDYRDSRSKSSDAKMDDLIGDFSYTSPRSSSEKEGSDKMLSKSECDSFRSRSSLDAESADESGMNSEQLSQLERKKRLLASSNVKTAKDTIISSKLGSDKVKPKNSTCHNSLKSSKGNCLSEASIEELKSELESVNLQYECAKEKYQNDCANSELKYLKKRQLQILHLLDQAHESVNSSDNDCSIDTERISRKKHRSSSTCLDSNSICESDIKSHTKDEIGSKLCKSGIKDPSILPKFKKTESADDNNCVSISLDSFSFRKHLDPRKGFDQHSVSLVNSLQKTRRISVDNDTCLPNTHGTETFLCVPSSVSADVSWKKQCSSLSDVNFSENETDSSITLSHFKVKQDPDIDDEIVNKKSHLSNSHSLDLPKGFMSLRTFADGLSCHDIKRERDISPLSLPLPKFAASLRSPKSSPSILTSPKSTTAHSPRAGHSPSYASGKNIRIPDLLHDIPSDKKMKDIVPEDKINGANISPMDSTSAFESHGNNDTLESIPSVEPIQSPKSNCDKIKECLSSSESDYSPSSSPNRPSIEDRIKALDEKFNAWSGSTRTASGTLPDVTPSALSDLTSKCPLKRSRFSYLPDSRKEPSEIVKSLLARSTIFDQDSKRLQHIDEKYEPLDIKMDLSPKVKPTFRTKAAAKEFSTPIAPTLQSFSQSLLVKSPSTVMVAQGIMSPPTTPQSSSNSIVSPVTPMPQYTQLPSSVFTPCSPRSSPFNLPPTLIKTENIDKDITEQILKSPQVFNSVKVKADPNFHANSAALATSLKSSPLMCPAETPSHGSVVTAITIKEEPASPTEADTQSICNMETEIKPIKKEIADSANIPIKKENTSSTSVTKDHSHFNSVDHDKKEFCDSKDPRLSFNEENGQWRENGCKEDVKPIIDSSAKSFSCTEISESPTIPAAKKRVSSIDSNESDSSKSLKSLESSRDSQEVNWSKQDKASEPEPKKPKLNKSTRERSISPSVTHQLSKKNDKKEKSKSDKNKSVKSSTSNNPEKVRHETKCNRNDYKDKSKDHKSSKEEKRSKSKDFKDFGSKSETKSKSQERRNSEKDSKNSNSNNTPSNKPKKDSANKAEKSNEKKQSEKKSRSKSNKFDFSAFMDDEPVYFSMYDKVKARSSKSQTLKHQTTSDLESVRQKFSKLKQSRAKREEKSKSVDHDSDKDSDSSHHSSESDSEAKPVKVKQQRKRKLVIESSSDEEAPSQEAINQSSKTEKDFQSDSATDSDFAYSITHRQTNSKTRRKKTELLDSDSSDSDSNFITKPQHSGRKKPTNRTKGRLEKSKKIIKSDDDASDIDTQKNQKSREKEKAKKIKKEKEIKVELEMMDCDITKRLSEDIKSSKKKLSKDAKSESDLSPVQKKFKLDHSSKEKSSTAKEKKTESSNEKMQSSEEMEKHKPYSKKRKKSKKMCRNKDKRICDKISDDASRKQMEESDTKSSLPVLLSPKPSSPLPDKQLSPPCLQAGALSDNDFKSDFSDFDFENQANEDMDTSRDMWKHLDAKSDTNSEKSSKNKKEISKLEPEQDSLPSFFDKLSDITDSETGRETNDFNQDVNSDTSKHISFSVRKEKDPFVSTSPHKSKHDKREEQNTSKQDSGKYSDAYTSPSKEERRRKKSKKQCKERKKKIKEDAHPGKDEVTDSTSVSSPKTSLFKTVGGDEDSRISDIRLDEEIAEEARRLEQELLAASEETSTFGDDGPAKREEKLLERRFEEEAAKETRRLEAELLSTGRDSWHMKEKEYDSEANSGDICDDKHVNEMDSLIGKEDNIFAGLELHSSMAESSQNDADVFLSGHSEADPYKIDDKDVSNEIEDQRKIEDDLAVSALLQEMNCGEIPAPELTKESDYLEMETHPDETMNYLLPDDGENSLHIADSSPDNQVNDSQEGKLESDDIVLSPSSNSEPPPALEISTVEESILMKINNENQTSECLKAENLGESQILEHKPSYEYHDENSLELCESKPPVIDLPNMQEKAEPLGNPVSPKSEILSTHKKRINDKTFRIPTKPDAINNNEDTDDECSSDLTENQLTHFEDITNDTADSKDDDNPPILLPVASPPNLLPANDSKEQMEPLDKVTIDNQCLDRIIGKAPTSHEGGLFSNVDLDKQIGDIINSITEKNKKLDDTDSFRMPGSRSMSDLSNHNVNDPLGLSNSGNLYNSSKTEEINNPQDFDPNEILKPSKKEITNSNSSNVPLNYTEESNSGKFDTSQNTSTCAVEPSILNYSEILNSSNCETSVIQSTQKIDSNAVTISITEKTDLPNIEHFEENKNNTAQTNQTSSDNFILELFGSKNEENFKMDSEISSNEKDKNSEFETNSESKNKVSENDLSTIDFGLQHEIKPLFEIPEVNEQNEATEFNQEIFERPSETNKEEHVPRLLSFSSEHLFADNSSKKEENLSKTENSTNVAASSCEKQDVKICDNPSKSDIEDNIPEHIPNDLETNKDAEFEKKSDNAKEDEGLNIEESLENKLRPADAESVCSDTTDITIPETKIESEACQIALVEEPVQEDICPVEEAENNVKSKIERPRRGRRPKTRRYVESQKSEPVPEVQNNPPVNMRITRRSGNRPTSSERPRRSLRSDTSEPILPQDSNENKLNSVDDAHPEVEIIKKNDEITESSVNEAFEVENSASSNVHSETEPKLSEKSSVKVEEPRKRRGRRKKNSGDHISDKIEPKFEEHDLSKDLNRPKESRLLLSLSDREQKSTKESSNVDVYEFTDEDDDNTKFGSVKERLHESTRGNVSDSKRDSKIFDSVFEKKENICEEEKQKSKGISVDDKDTASREHHATSRESSAKDHHNTSKDHYASKETSSKEQHTSKEVAKEPVSKEQNKKRSKLSMVIRLQKDGHDGTAEVIKTSEAIEDSKSESSKSEKNSSTKHDSVSEVPHNGPLTRKSTRLMNQSKNNVDKVIEDVVKAHSRSSSSNNSNSHSEPAPTRVTRRSRSSRRSEESIQMPSESSNDVSEDKNKNDPLYFIPDNAVKDVIPETKKNTSNHAVEVTRASDASASDSENKNNNNKQSLRAYRMRKDASQSSAIPNEQDFIKKESVSYSSAEDKFDALQKEHKEAKESLKETKYSTPENPAMQSFPVLSCKVEISKLNLQTYANPDKNSVEIDDSSVVKIDPRTGFLTTESFPETPCSSSNNDKNTNFLVSDASIITSVKTDTFVSENSNVSSVIQESPKVSQSSETQVRVRAPLNLRSRSIPAPVPTQSPVQPTQSAVQNSTSHSDSSSRPKPTESVKMPIKKAACSAIPVLTIASSTVSTSVNNTSTESVLVTSSASIPITQNQPPVITSLGTPVATAVTQSSASSLEKGEDVHSSGLSKPPHSSHVYPSSVRAIVTAVVTQMSPGVPMPSNVQTKCSTNTTTSSSTPPSSSSSSVLMTPELPIVHSSANIPPTSVNEHLSNISCKSMSLPSPMTSEQSNIPLPKEAHMFPSATTAVTSSWVGPKVSASRITEIHNSATTPPTSSVNNPIYTTKSETRSSKVSKNSSAFTQQSGFPLSYETSVLSGAHTISSVSNPNGGMIAELLQHQQKEYYAAAVGQLPDRIPSQVRAGTPAAPNLPPEVAARLVNPTSPHTPTPPMTSANHSSEIHSPHVNSLHLRHPPQSPLIVPSHPTLPMPDLAYVHHHLLNHLAPSFHPDMRAQQEAQVRAAAIAMNSRYAYSIPPNAVPTNSYGPHTDRLPSVMDAKSEQKVINDLSKINQELRGMEEKSLHSVKSGRSKKDKEDKVIHPDRDDHESRHISAHDKVSATSTIKPHAMRQQHLPAHFSSTIHQLSPHLASPHERITDSPIVVANPYATGQGRVPPIPISGQIDDHNKPESLSLSSHHYKSDNTDMKQPPAAHQTQPNIPYHSLGVLSTTVHIDGRTSNPAHSPSSHIYKKDSSHNQQIPQHVHNPATVKRPKSEHSSKEHSRTHLSHQGSHQGSSISPGPVGHAPAHSPVSWHISSNSHSSMPQSPHVILSTNEQSNRRMNPHIAPQLAPDVRVHPPPPAHTLSQPTNVPARTLPQTPPHSNQVPSHDAYILRRYPVMWQGLLALKNAQAAVQMHFVSGNANIARLSLPPIVEGEAQPVRISQRMRLDPAQLDGVYRKIQLNDEHCILMALPCGKNQEDLVQQSNNLKCEFINYLMSKGAAGIVNAAPPGSQQPAFVIHIFPSCDFIQTNLSRIAPNLLHLVNEISHLVIIIATV